MVSEHTNKAKGIALRKRLQLNKMLLIIQRKKERDIEREKEKERERENLANMRTVQPRTSRSALDCRQDAGRELDNAQTAAKNNSGLSSIALGEIQDYLQSSRAKDVPECTGLQERSPASSQGHPGVL